MKFKPVHTQCTRSLRIAADKSSHTRLGRDPSSPILCLVCWWQQHQKCPSDKCEWAGVCQGPGCILKKLGKNKHVRRLAQFTKHKTWLTVSSSRCCFVLELHPVLTAFTDTSSHCSHQHWAALRSILAKAPQKLQQRHQDSKEKTGYVAQTWCWRV